MLMDSRIKYHRKNPKNPLLHSRLILLIYEHVKVHDVHKNIVSPKDNPTKIREGYETNSGEERDSKKPKKKGLILNK